MFTQSQSDGGVDQLDWPFRRAVLLLVESESYLLHQRYLASIAAHQHDPFLALLREGVPLGECFRHLQRFEAWQAATLQLAARQGIEPGSTAQQVALYLLSQQPQEAW